MEFARVEVVVRARWIQHIKLFGLYNIKRIIWVWDDVVWEMNAVQSKVSSGSDDS